MAVCWVGIGANIGDTHDTFDVVLSRLGGHPQIQLGLKSGIYHTRPIGAVAGGGFSNAAFSLTSSLAPLQLLDLLQEIETDLGRTRSVRWGPRPIDLDLLFVDQLILNTPRLTLPHPAAWYRRFVLDPLCELAPHLVHPLLGETIAALKHRLSQRPLIVGIEPAHEPLLAALQAALEPVAPEVRLEPLRERRAVVAVRLQTTDSPAAHRGNVPAADLTSAPGDLSQRMIDFCTAILDEPVRASDW